MKIQASGSQPCLIYILTGGVNDCRFQSCSCSPDPLKVAHQLPGIQRIQVLKQMK